MTRFITLTALLITTISQAQIFSKVTTGPLVNTPGDSRSVNWIDTDNDGYIDCLITNGPTGGQNNKLYINDGVGNFTALSGDSIVLDNKPSDGATMADTDNDGDMDCFVVNWYNVNNMYYINNGTGAFTKLNGGIETGEGGYSETAAWGDFDNDGLVDLYVTNSAGTKKNFMYRNTGSNTFTKVISGTPVNDAFKSRCVNWTDMDLDGDLDLFVTNEGTDNENIYRNDGSGNFTRISNGLLVNDGGNTMSSSWGDYDNDGDLDVFLANDQGNNALFRNDLNFTFTKITSDTVSKTPANSFSSSWSDVDNDGDLDLFVTNAFKPSTRLVNYFYKNNGNGTFARVSDAITADSAWCYGCAFGDYDNDGFEDLAVATCRYNNIDVPDLLYHNNGNANKWLTVKLSGTISNRAAIGAKIKIKATISGNPTWQMREISSQSAYCSENDLRAHFGLGNATAIDSLVILWPSGIKQVSTGLNVNQHIAVTESYTFTSLNTTAINAGVFSLFPNPASGSVTIQAAAAFQAGDELILTDISGKSRQLIKFQTVTRQHVLELKKFNLSPGEYTVSHISDGKKTHCKLVIVD